MAKTLLVPYFEGYILSGTGAQSIGMMKKINDPDPNNRVFTDSNGKQQLWRGKILITTNKDMAKLSTVPTSA